MTRISTDSIKVTQDVSPPETQDVSCEDADGLLMMEVARGSESALRILIRKWENPLMNFFYRSIQERSTAEDLTWQTFVNLYRARDSYEQKAKFSTYLFFVARRVLINEYRRRARKPAEPIDPSELDIPSDDVRSAQESSEIEEFFYKTLETMPENQRTAILLLKQQELSYDEIAETMGASVASVKTWIHRARLTLREAIQQQL